MFKIKKKRAISSLLSVALVFGLLGSSVVSTGAVTSTVTSSGGTGTSKVATTIEPSIFSATVPYLLPISIDADQNVYTADNVVISNNSNGPIKVSDATLTTNDGWELVADGTDFSSVPVNSKQFSMKLLNTAVATSGDIDVIPFDTINGNESIAVTYDADVAVQGEAVSDIGIANVVFTLEWDNVEITSATVKNTSLMSFARTVTTFQRTSERLNIDDVKSISGIRKIDDGTTDKSIYAWADSNGNGYWWTNAMIAYLPDDCSELFAHCSKLVFVDLTGFNTSKVTTMEGMFRFCTVLQSIDFSSLDTSNVNNMGGMFSSCHKLKSLDLSNWDTSNVTIMETMFYACEELSLVDISSFDTSNVTSMRSMFAFCQSLTSLDLSSFDTVNVTNMENMFNNCKTLKSLNLSSFDTSNVTNMGWMFTSCQSLVSLNIVSFDTSNVTDMSAMFSYCQNLTSLDLSSFNTSNVINTSGMFNICKKLSLIEVNSFNTDDVTNSNYMFTGCINLVGGNGTRYNSSFIDKTYARIDTADTPGYFTYKAKAA